MFLPVFVDGNGIGIGLIPIQFMDWSCQYQTIDAIICNHHFKIQFPPEFDFFQHFKKHITHSLQISFKCRIN